MSELSEALTQAAAEAIEERLANETGGCHCDPAFSERDRQDPGCVYCQAGGVEFGALAARPAVAAVLQTLADELEVLRSMSTEHLRYVHDDVYDKRTETREGDFVSAESIDERVEEWRRLAAEAREEA